MPALMVYTTNEKSQEYPDGSQLQRALVLTIEGAVVQTEGQDIDDDLDALIFAVENAIKADPQIVGILAQDLILTNTMTEVYPTGEKIFAAFQLTFDAHYFTAFNDPDAIDDGTGFPPVEDPAVLTVWSQSNFDSQPAPI